eukprot:TRINITY_DN69700_c0_g1_i1.p1 TRINITY_DN69700_c0_g1~~TRINITY_DN69700_c0_g1_i1.p1  ORF type:complete len:402 (-),score=70.70 TRINITY_DN69700_c0_g1_i1:55-1260(-)
MQHAGESHERKREKSEPQQQGTELAKYPVPEQPEKIGAANGVLDGLIEFSTEEGQKDPNEDIEFGEMPNRCICPHCEKTVVTFIDYETSWVTWVLGFVVWISLGWMAFWVLPLLWPAFKDVVHHCPRCLNVIARKSRIHLPTFKTEVCSLKIGNCTIMLARKYVIIFFLMVGTIIGVYMMRSFVHLNTAPELSKGPSSSATWDDFLFDCGPKSQLRARTSVATVFEEKYRRKTFKWQGEVRVIREGFEIFMLKTKSVIMVRMYPSRFPHRDLPDIALLFGDSLNKEVADLNPGDWVEFEATLSVHGYRGDPELMTLWHVKTLEKPDPLSSSGGNRLAEGSKPADDRPKPVEAEPEKSKREEPTDVAEKNENAEAAPPEVEGDEKAEWELLKSGEDSGDSGD